MNTLVDELYGQDSSVINLSVDTIDPFLLSGCKDAFELATMHSMAVCDPAMMFTYGPRQGSDSFRTALADFLKHQCGADDIKSDNLMLAGDETQTLTLICNAFFKKGDTVFVEEPISPKELSILTTLCLNIIPVSLQKDGIINISKLDKELSKVSKDSSNPFSCGLYLTPFYQNPTGMCLHSEACQQIVEVINKYNCLCISNDIYQCFSYDKGKAPFGPPPKRLISYEIGREANGSSGNVISIGSFSTLFCPGLGMGWLEALPNILDYIKDSPFVRYGGFSQQYLSGVMESALGLGLVKDSFESLRLTFHTRLEHLCKAIAEKLPDCSFIKPKGGLFVWLTLPLSIDSQVLRKLCKEKYKIDFLPGSEFSVNSSKFTNNLRLSISWYGHQTILNGITQL